MFGRLVFKAAVADRRECQLNFSEHVGIESVVARDLNRPFQLSTWGGVGLLLLYFQGADICV